MIVFGTIPLGNIVSRMLEGCGHVYWMTWLDRLERVWLLALCQFIVGSGVTSSRMIDTCQKVKGQGHMVTKKRQGTLTHGSKKEWTEDYAWVYNRADSTCMFQDMKQSPDSESKVTLGQHLWGNECIDDVRGINCSGLLYLLLRLRLR